MAPSLCLALVRIVLPGEVFSPGEEAVVGEVVAKDQLEWQRRSKLEGGCWEETAQLALEDVRPASDEVCCGEEEWCGAQWWPGRRWLASPQMWCRASLWLKGFDIRCRWGRGGGRQIDGVAGHWRGGAGREYSDGEPH